MNRKNTKNKTTRGLQASVEGFAHEHIAAGILMKRYQNVSLVDLPLSPYDLIIVLKKKGRENIIRAQVKTATKGISFVGGMRGGIDRIYKSDVKKYIQSTLTSDVVIGVSPKKEKEVDEFTLYFIPTILVEHLGQSSISLRKVQNFKNNYELLERCKEKDFVLKKAREFGLLTP